MGTVKYMKNCILIPLLAIFMVSCADRETIRLLDDVESYISEVLTGRGCLDSLSGTGIQGKEANAKFSLLYSMVRDKNYMDVTDDSLVNIAVDWYRRHGTADERLKSYYYQGRVYQNAGDNEAVISVNYGRFSHNGLGFQAECSQAHQAACQIHHGVIPGNIGKRPGQKREMPFLSLQMPECA